MKGLCLRGEQRNQQNQTTSAVVCLSLCMGWGEVGRGGVRWVEAERGGVRWDWLGEVERVGWRGVGRGCRYHLTCAFGLV